MSTKDEIERFLHEGLVHYADASEAVTEFKRQIRDRLIGSLKGKKDWRNFMPRVDDRPRDRAVTFEEYADSDGTALHAYQGSTQEDGGWIDLGLWWRSSAAPDGVLAHCTRRGKTWSIQAVDLPNPKPPIECGPVKGNDGRLYVVLDPVTADLDATFRLLLDEMDRALGNRAGA